MARVLKIWRPAIALVMLTHCGLAIAGETETFRRGPFGATADLRIVVSDSLTEAASGCPLSYQIYVDNLGPDGVQGVSVTDLFPAALQNVEWTCDPEPGSACTLGPQLGDILDTNVDLPNGGRVVYTVRGQIAPGQTGTLVNTATVNVMPPDTDPNPINDSSTDNDTAVSVTPTGSNGPGVWVLNGGSNTIDVINACTDQLGAEIALPGGDAPRGLAFSTIPNNIGSFAFVGQGTQLIVIDTTTRLVVDNMDVSTLTGVPPSSDIQLAGLASARVQLFTDANSEVVKGYLHVAANISPAGGGPAEPWFIVMDQAAILGVAPVGSPLVVGADPLFDGLPSGADGKALDVTVIAAPSGTDFQRAWYTVAIPAAAPLIRAIEVTGRREIQAPDWQRRRIVERALPAVAAQPERLVVGTAIPGREVTLLPESTSNTLVDLHLARPVCDLGVGSDLIDVAITGPAKNNLQTFILDRGNQQLRVIDDDDYAGTCGTTDVSVGAGPIAMDSLGRVEFQKFYVANQDDDTVTVINDLLMANSIPLGSNRAGNCVDCPVEVRVQRTPATSCNIRDLTVESDMIFWTPVGCTGEDVRFRVWCQCTEDNPVDCPPECPATSRSCPGCHTIGSDDWEELGETGGTDFPSVPGDKSVGIVVTYDDKLP
ncbi:MAG: DUF11 domain-containing protein [Acidobacteriota bacterium]|nr:DUF11 domain-containing protein [Acidobacteriota bacterium]